MTARFILALRKAYQYWTDLETHEKVLRVYVWLIILAMFTIPWLEIKHYEKTKPSEDQVIRAAQAYDSGFSSGGFVGYDPGYLAGYDAGYACGRSDDYQIGMHPEFEVPEIDQSDIFYKEYFKIENREEYTEGFIAGYKDSYSRGYLDGYTEGATNGYRQTRGF